MPMVDHHRLTKARAIIANGWTKDAFAVNSAGEPCELQDPDAKKFCLVGAMVKAGCHMGDLEVVRRVAFKDNPVSAPPVGGLIPWNNMAAQTQEGVLKVMDEAVEMTLDGIEINSVYNYSGHDAKQVSKYDGSHPQDIQSENIH